MTKILLTFVLCTQTQMVCMPPIEAGFYDDYYQCMEKGYEKSLEIVKNLGIESVNKEKFFIKFKCTEVSYEGI